MDAHPNLPERITSRLEVIEETGCWMYRGHCTRDGYPMVSYEGRTWLAHRLIWKLLKGQPVPSKSVLDHLLRDRKIAPGPCLGPPCCNPDHVQVVSVTTNGKRVRGWNGRKTHCPAGHSYATDGKTYTCKDGATRRYCTTCRKLRGNLHHPGIQDTGRSAPVAQIQAPLSDEIPF